MTDAGVNVKLDEDMTEAAARDPAVRAAFAAARARAEAVSSRGGASLIEGMDPDTLASWDGSDEMALVGPATP